jgi:hypothetical protein
MLGIGRTAATIDVISRQKRRVDSPAPSGQPSDTLSKEDPPMRREMDNAAILQVRAFLDSRFIGRYA